MLRYLIYGIIATILLAVSDEVKHHAMQRDKTTVEWGIMVRSLIMTPILWLIIGLPNLDRIRSYNGYIIAFLLITGILSTVFFRKKQEVGRRYHQTSLVPALLISTVGSMSCTFVIAKTIPHYTVILMTLIVCACIYFLNKPTGISNKDLVIYSVLSISSGNAETIARLLNVVGLYRFALIRAMHRKYKEKTDWKHFDVLFIVVSNGILDILATTSIFFWEPKAIIAYNSAFLLRPLILQGIKYLNGSSLEVSKKQKTMSMCMLVACLIIVRSI